MDIPKGRGRFFFLRGMRDKSSAGFILLVKPAGQEIACEVGTLGEEIIILFPGHKKYHSGGNEKRLHLPEPTEFTQPDLVQDENSSV